MTKKKEKKEHKKSAHEKMKEHEKMAHKEMSCSAAKKAKMK
jgi:hypothetical protein